MITYTLSRVTHCTKTYSVSWPNAMIPSRTLRSDPRSLRFIIYVIDGENLKVPTRCVGSSMNNRTPALLQLLVIVFVVRYFPRQVVTWPFLGTIRLSVAIVIDYKYTVIRLTISVRRSGPAKSVRSNGISRILFLWERNKTSVHISDRLHQTTRRSREIAPTTVPSLIALLRQSHHHHIGSLLCIRVLNNCSVLFPPHSPPQFQRFLYLGV